MQSGRGHLSCDPHRGFLHPGSRTLSPWHSPLFCATVSCSLTSSPALIAQGLSKEGCQPVVVPLAARQSRWTSGPWWEALQPHSVRQSVRWCGFQVFEPQRAAPLGEMGDVSQFLGQMCPLSPVLLAEQQLMTQ